ncbi:carboxynorspermidine decarboxylase [Methylogaea oryzae]|uniref:Carboxynorspermidine/carboxyspermidine decarboxylase n=1 Tax=Methylogaea oryzae TaxID=1295382 RepID=A0A8D4VTH5_9GAMM|nr:carboxynorspermidine decarboxylase [Methylogaea oryzae]BBL72229.1 hypothetical protein MoryE10_28350 [Methylogaea oryzae]
MPSAAILPSWSQQPGLETPAFVYDERLIEGKLAVLRQGTQGSGLKVLYSIKALPFRPLLELVRPWVEGFSVSSLFEARLAAEVLAGRGDLHLTSPGLRLEDAAELAEPGLRIGFNSLGQWQRLHPLLRGRASCGLRINPEISFLDDARYDPCRPHSKLGVPLSQVAALGDARPQGVQGIHFHTVFQARDFAPLRQTVARIEAALGDWLAGLQWINLGGGYTWDTPEDLAGLVEVAQGLRRRWDVEVLFEPGKAVVGEAGCLAARVLDVFDSGGKTVAVLDTSVNHNPEVFEYQRRPALLNEAPGGVHNVILAGGTCLAGDVFGEYRLAGPPRPGDLMVFANVGAYSLIKANRFNGHNLPSIYALDGDGCLQPRKGYGYEDYRRQWSA